MATYEVRLPTGHVVTRTVPDGASDEVVRKVFADEMRRAGINVDEQQVVRRKTLGDLVNENKKPTLKDGFQGEITTPQRNVSGRVSDYINAALVEAGVDERYAAHLSGRVESFLGDLTPTGNLDGLLYGHSDLERQLSILPIPGPERKAIIKGIRAWHGSPHDFDKFSLSKIGTGEGAQAYGHGLYFAENPKVAEDYRRTLSPRPSDINDPAHDIATNWIGRAGGDRAKAAQMMDDYLREAGVNPAEFASVRNYITNPPGRLYEVNINARPEDFLNWDAPLAQQPEHIRKGVANTLEQLSPGLGLDFAPLNGGELRPRTPLEAQALRQHGIPGIRYLDQGSRGAANGTSNYVVFDDSLIDILNKY